MQEGRRSVQPEANLPPSFEKDTRWPLMVETPKPLEVAPLVRQVVIVGKTQRHSHIGGLVTLDAAARTDDINRYGGGQRHDQQDRADEGGAGERRRRPWFGPVPAAGWDRRIAHGDIIIEETTDRPAARRGGVWRARPRAGACRAAPSCGRTRDVVVAAGRARGARQRARSRRDDRSPRRSCRRARRRFASARSSASWSSVRMSSSPSASVATIGFPIASASKAVSGVPSQSDGNTLRSNADSVRGDVAPEAGEDEPIAETERARLRLRSASSGPSPTRKNRARGPLARRRARRRRPDTSCPSTRGAA